MPKYHFSWFGYLVPCGIKLSGTRYITSDWKQVTCKATLRYRNERYKDD